MRRLHTGQVVSMRQRHAHCRSVDTSVQCAAQCRGGYGRSLVNVHPFIRLAAVVSSIVLGKIIDVVLPRCTDREWTRVDAACAEGSREASDLVDCVKGLLDTRCAAATWIGSGQRDRNARLVPAKAVRRR